MLINTKNLHLTKINLYPPYMLKNVKWLIFNLILYFFV